MTATELLDREFLEIRARIIDLAASFDRLERAPGSVDEDPRWQQILQATSVLLSGAADRTVQVQRTFSLDFDHQWRAKWGLAASQ